MLKNFLFKFLENNEEFIVEAVDLNTAKEILELEGFDLEKIKFLYKVNDYEKETSGLDIYWYLS